MDADTILRSNLIHKEFWKDKKVLLTGHTGFKGSWLTLWLEQLEAHVLGLSLPPKHPKGIYNQVLLKEKDSWGDITCYQTVLDRLESFQPEIIIHMAAQALVLDSYQDPIRTYQTNVMGTANLLNASRALKKLKVFLNVTTDKCYENKDWLWAYRENDALGGHDPYSNSKACSELLTQSFRDSFFTNGTSAIISARAGNVYGGGDRAQNRLIPDAVLAFEQKKPVQIRNPKSTRPWQHVLDPLRGYMLLIQKAYYSSDFVGAWNFGPKEKNESVEKTISIFANAWGNTADWFTCATQPKPNAPGKQHEAKTLSLDCSKAEQILGWHPKISLEKGLYLSASWYQAQNKGASKKELKELSIQQIYHYGMFHNTSEVHV